MGAMTRSVLVGVVCAGLAAGQLALAQEQEGQVQTQVLVAAEGATPPGSASDITVTVDGRKVPLRAWTQVAPEHAQVALLIDDGLRESMGRNLGSLQAFVKGLPLGTEILIGYMQNGRVDAVRPFTTDHAAAAQGIRLPQGLPGASASPYFCLSDFVKHWPGAEATEPNAGAGMVQGAPIVRARARFVLMITNGVDPYNGSTSVMNQDSPYVKAAINDAQRSGVAVYSIYFSDAGIRGGGASFSGQSYLQEVADATGGRSYYEGVGNPVSMDPFFKQFIRAVQSTYIADFDAPAGRRGKDLLQFKVSSAQKAKLRAPTSIRPGNRE